MKTGAMMTLLVLTGIALTSGPSADQVNEIAVTTLQNETAADHMKIKDPDLKELLKDAFRKMRAADGEVQAFAKRNASKKVKQGSWRIYEESETNGVHTVMSVDFSAETGPVCLGVRFVFQDKSHQKELKGQRLELYYHENGRVKIFMTRGDPAIILQFYPSGRVKLFCISAPDNTTIAAFNGGDDDAITNEVFSGLRTDKDKSKP